MFKSVGKYLKSCAKSIDPVLFVCTVLLSLISIVTVMGAVDNFGTRKLIMQAAMTAAGIIVTFIIANIDYHQIVDKLWVFMIAFSVSLPIEMLVLLGIMGISTLIYLGKLVYTLVRSERE